MRHLNNIGINSKKAFEKLKKVDHKKIRSVLENYSLNILKNKKLIIRENIKDVKNVKRKKLIDRLILNDKRIDEIRNSINDDELKDYLSNKFNFEKTYEFALHPNYPNPFNPKTNIIYESAKKSDVTIIITNILGQKITQETLYNKNSGEYLHIWDVGNWTHYKLLEVLHQQYNEIGHYHLLYLIRSLIQKFLYQ